MLPAGMSFEFSCTRSFCQSVKMQLSAESRSQRSLLVQFGFAHSFGSVNLNCCSTPRTFAPQAWHPNEATSISGRTSVVFVIVPISAISLPIFALFMSLMLSISG